MANDDFSPVGPGPDPNNGCEHEDVNLPAVELAAALAPGSPPKAVPVGNPVPFARSQVAIGDRHWPVMTALPTRLVVSYQAQNDAIIGVNGRQFLALRNGGNRLHVGIDLFANAGDEIVACEAGTIVNYYRFYQASSGQMTYALLIEHGDLVANYGEVRAGADSEFNWRIGAAVVAGQPVARAGDTRMLHFEAYVRGTRENHRWLPGKPAPPALLNPTAYLLEIASSPAVA